MANKYYHKLFRCNKFLFLLAVSNDKCNDKMINDRMQCSCIHINAHTHARTVCVREKRERERKIFLYLKYLIYNRMQIVQASFNRKCRAVNKRTNVFNSSNLYRYKCICVCMLWIWLVSFSVVANMNRKFTIHVYSYLYTISIVMFWLFQP